MRDSGYENKMIQLNYELNGHKKGSKIKIRTKDGVPVDPYWRERLKDSKMDKCIEFCNKGKKKETKEVEKEATLNSKSNKGKEI